MIKFIADCGSNHNQDWDRCRQLIDTCKAIGCYAVKFQLFTSSSLYAPGFGDIQKLKKSELPLDFIPAISKRCDELGLVFGCSPFSLQAVNVLEDYVDFFKISSFDILRKDLIQKCLDTHKHLIISCGMATYQDISNVDSQCAMNDISLLHCVSNYPTLPIEADLKEIQKLKSFGRPVGWSDHTVEPGVIYQAIQNGAEIIEFHIDLDDMQGRESHVGHCWSASKIKEVIHNIDIAHTANNYKAESLFYKDYLLQRADPDDGMRPMKAARGK